MAWSSFGQLYHSLPSYTWFEPILTPLWSSYLVWTILTNKLILIFVLTDGLKFFWTIISFTAILHVVWAYFDTIMILLSCLNNFNQQTHLNFCSKRWLEVLLDNHFFLYTCILNEWGSDHKNSTAYLGALPAKESICVTQIFQSENCPNCHPTKICGLHSSEAIAAIVIHKAKGHST